MLVYPNACVVGGVEGAYACGQSLQSCRTPYDPVACQAALSMELSRQEYWSGLPCPSPGDLPQPGTEPMSLMSPALAGGFLTISATWEAPYLLLRWLQKLCDWIFYLLFSPVVN